jgi:arabinose-5-phosphate isomerase
MSAGILNTARKILRIEARAIASLTRRLGREFLEAVDLACRCEGRVIVTGMGKPGFIGRKIAATMASTGTPSLFLHPAEALHGDLGMVTIRDLVIAISQSGETEEILKLVAGLRKIGVPLIAMTSGRRSTLAKQADIVLDLGVGREACPLNLAPSASTTAALALGDALALSMLEKKGFREEDFATLHPGGSLGRKLLKVRDLMRTGAEHPIVTRHTTIRKALVAITTSRAGSCTVVNAMGHVVGIFTDGDLRRHLQSGGGSFLDDRVGKHATSQPVTIHQDRPATEALSLIRHRRIDELPVVNDLGQAVGLLDIQDLLKAGFV